MTDLTISYAKKKIAEELAGIYPQREVMSLTRIILSETANLSFSGSISNPGLVLTNKIWDKINKICHDLKKGIPIQYILGKTEFYGLELLVSTATLIPRQETEELVDLIIKENPEEGLDILDIGTGSGAIAICMAKFMNRVNVTASDVSEEALIIAGENALKHKCNITFASDDIFKSSFENHSNFDIIVSNPPYIRESEKKLMSPLVTEHEPHKALFVPDSDPLVFYRAIGILAKKSLKNGAKLYLEINEALGKETAWLLEGMGFQQLRILKDLNNKDRIITAINKDVNQY
ncbi:MAG: peptide chain release factor N(5)-glutamine methyltransferase [Marinilabiliaceae bacterium]|jgi:release factor glutamine methyltransferase|nr:peptide chain release factor N(5)-glutamine methyltransferase [Marinilabiliaceae bacterium]